MLYIDTEGGNTDELRDSIIAAHPSYTAFGLTGDVVEASVGSMTSVYYLVFAITVLMVGFIIVSMSRSVVNERMADRLRYGLQGPTSRSSGTFVSLILQLEHERVKIRIWLMRYITLHVL